MLITHHQQASSYLKIRYTPFFFTYIENKKYVACTAVMIFILY